MDVSALFSSVILMLLLLEGYCAVFTIEMAKPKLFPEQFSPKRVRCKSKENGRTSGQNDKGLAAKEGLVKAQVSPEEHLI